jgi:hypothetical protein
MTIIVTLSLIWNRSVRERVLRVDIPKRIGRKATSYSTCRSVLGRELSLLILLNRSAASDLLQWFQPVTAVSGLPVEQAEKCILYFSSQVAAAAIADRHMVYLAHRCDFSRRAGHENFIRPV